MFCPNCGNEISDNSKYCNKCGIEIRKIAKIEIIKHFGILKILCLLIIISIICLCVLKFFVLNGKYEELSIYYDLKKNPYKYDYNYLISKELIKEDYGKDKSVYKQIVELDKLYREQNNEKSKIILKYVDDFYDEYRSILNDDYKNIKELKFDINDILNCNELKKIASDSVLLFPEPESIKELKNNLELKKSIKNQIKKQYNVNIDLNEINFYPISQKDDFFVDFSDITSEDKNKNLENIVILREELNKKTTEKEKIAFYIKTLLPEYRKLIYQNIMNCTCKQFYAKTVKNGTKYIYKIKPLKGGTALYWEISEEKENNSFFQKSFDNSDKKIQDVTNKIKNIILKQ